MSFAKKIGLTFSPLQIVELLLPLSEPKKLYEALLLAISLDHDEIAEVILKHPIYEKLEKQEQLYASTGQVREKDREITSRAP